MKSFLWAMALAVVGALVTQAQAGNLPFLDKLDPVSAAVIVAAIIAAGTAFIDSHRQ